MNSTLWFASTNKGKINDLKQFLKNDFILKTIDDLPFEFDVDEDCDSFEGNSLKKARSLYEIVKEPVIADDSGLLVTNLNNFPGVHSNRWYIGFAKGWNEVNALLLKRMAEANLHTKEERKARFETVITYFDGSVIEQFKGEKTGTISLEQKGNAGFGYAPIFIPDGSELTQAEMKNSNRIKNSHRANALNKFMAWIKEKK